MEERESVTKAREEFLEHIWMMIKYWNDLDATPHPQDKLEGLAFSILNALDGTANVPPHYVIPVTDEDEEKGVSLENDIAGALHEKFYEVGERLGITKKV